MDEEKQIKLTTVDLAGRKYGSHCLIAVKQECGEQQGRGGQPEKQQLCLFEVRAGFNFLEGVFCALVKIFLTPCITQVW